MIRLIRTAAGDSAVIGNGNGPMGISSMRALRDPGSYSGDINCPGGAGTQELPGLWPYLFKSTERKNMNQKTIIKILHEEWALNQGLRDKRQAASIKRQAASLKHVPRYVASDYKATSIKRQALKEIPHN
jgi:hypothetical protein